MKLQPIERNSSNYTHFTKQLPHRQPMCRVKQCLYLVDCLIHYLSDSWMHDKKQFDWLLNAVVYTTVKSILLWIARINLLNHIGVTCTCISIQWINSSIDKSFTVTAPVEIIVTNQTQLELKLMRHESRLYFHQQIL